MQSLLRPIVLRGSYRGLARLALTPNMALSPFYAAGKNTLATNYIKYNVGGVRSYSKERSNNDDDNSDDKDKDKENKLEQKEKEKDNKEKAAKEKEKENENDEKDKEKEKDSEEGVQGDTASSPVGEGEPSEPSKASPTAVVVQEAKLPSHVQILAYHRIYMPGQVTPFDPNAQMRDGEYIGLFLSKKHPIKPITSFLVNEEEETVKDSKGKVKREASSESKKDTDEDEIKPFQDLYEKYQVTLKELEAQSKTEAKKGKALKRDKTSKKEAKSKKSERAIEPEENTEKEEQETKDITEASKESEEVEKEEDSSQAASEKEKELVKEKDEESDKSDGSETSDSGSSASLELLKKKQSESGAMVDSTAVFDVGVLAQVDRQHPSGPRLRFLVPVRLSGGASRPGLGAKIEPHKVDPYDSHEIDEQLTRVKAVLSRAVELFPNQIVKNPVSEALLKQKDPNRFVFGLMAECSNYLAEAQAVLSTSSVGRRLALVQAVIEAETTIRQKQQEINKTLSDRTTKEQREFFLREQLKMVRKELGVERDEKEELIEKYRSRLTPDVPKEAMKVIEDELAKLQLLEPSSSEYSITRNYLDWLTILPWGIYSKENFNLAHAKTVLKEDHYGLQDLKTRILEFIAVGNLKGTVQGKIICLVGPPGVGKTSIGKSIARALDRKFYRFSVGGMHDISEIKGHRRTYVGAMPGKLLQCLKQVKTSNPVVLIDEIDKLGKGRQGDPASALLEVLDPEQNATFMDHYLDVPVDLSKVLFVCTANVKDAIPKPLLDRMEVMYLSGYIPEEQCQIVKQYLIPTATKEAGLLPKQIEIRDSAVQALVKSYCREAGVRNLQKHVEKIVRKVALMRVRGTKKTVIIDGDNINTFVGKPVFSSDRYYERTPSGIVMGLAWTQLGGSALYVETVLDPLLSRPEMRITGQLGDVMKESTSIAYTYSKNHLEQVAPGNRFFEGASLHMHIPEGATPKDGPSAGVTMVTSLLSLALDHPVLNNLAMTGELTLTGKVLRIGGVREKCIAAKRAGVKTIILPEGNMKDWADLPDNIKAGLKVHFADYYKDVFAVAFPNYKAPETIDAPATTTPKKPTKKSTKVAKKPTLRERVKKAPTTIKARTKVATKTAKTKAQKPTKASKKVKA